MSYTAINKNSSQWVNRPLVNRPLVNRPLVNRPLVNRPLVNTVVPSGQTGKKVLVNWPDTKETITKETNTKERGEASSPTPAQTAKDFFQMVEEKNERYEKFISTVCSVRNVGVEIVRAELDKFCSYWSERSKDGKRQRWEMEKTFEVQRRLATWFGNIKNFNQSSSGLKPKTMSIFIPSEQMRQWTRDEMWTEKGGKAVYTKEYQEFLNQKKL